MPLDKKGNVIMSEDKQIICDICRGVVNKWQIDYVVICSKIQNTPVICIPCFYKKYNLKESEMDNSVDKGMHKPDNWNRDAARITTAPAVDQIDVLLKARGCKYGAFDNHAKLTCGLSDVFYAHMTQYNKAAYEMLTDSQREALHMIFHKLGRIGNGDPNHTDSWVDIAGYAKLAANDIQSEQEFNNAPKSRD